jgi:hypothetical protein
MATLRTSENNDRDILRVYFDHLFTSSLLPAMARRLGHRFHPHLQIKINMKKSISAT